jgi:hypothetical protein
MSIATDQMITVTQGGILVSPFAVEAFREQFLDTGYAVIPGFLSPPVLNPLLKQLETASFLPEDERHVVGRTRMVPGSDPVIGSLHFMLNRPELFDIVSEISGVARPVNFTSRLHRTGGDSNEHIDWHDDGGVDRVLGLNINLSTQAYCGGLLQLRNPERKLVGEIGQLPAGDAFLFRVAEHWDHRLTPVESGERTVAVGWFRTKPDWEANALSWIRTGLILLDSENGR